MSFEVFWLVVDEFNSCEVAESDEKIAKEHETTCSYTALERITNSLEKYPWFKSILLQY